MASGDGRWSCEPDGKDPDPSLITWEKWVKIRENQIKVLAEKTDRPPIDLAMNLCEKVREKKEEKTVLENANLLKKATICKGTHWEQPERLKQCCCCQCQPVYEVHRTSTDVGRPPVIEHIGVPQYIQENEKGLAGLPQRNPCEKLNAEYNKYKEAQKNKLKSKIKKIDPYKAEIDELVLKGKQVKRPKKKVMLFAPNITLSAEINHVDKFSTIYALRINKTIFFKEQDGQALAHIKTIQNEPGHEFCKSWSYYFNVRKNKASRAKLYLENLGTASIRYCWKKIRRPVPFVPEDTHGQVFFFNKNEDVLFPGQKKTINFTFMSNQPGIYNEFWELSTNNIVFLETIGERLTINLCADSVDNIPNHTRNIEKLKQKIRIKSLYTIMTSIVVDIVKKSTSIEPPIYPYKKMLTEKEIFELKNPVYFYRQTEISKLKAIYSEMDLGNVWDLSIVTWRNAMMKKEFDDRMHYYELLKTSNAHLLKPWYEGLSLAEEKHRAVRLLLGKLANTFDKEYMRLSELYDGAFNDNDVTMQCVHNIFFLSMRQRIEDTIELCAGAISSLDLSRWIDFDFCLSNQNY